MMSPENQALHDRALSQTPRQIMQKRAELDALIPGTGRFSRAVGRALETAQRNGTINEDQAMDILQAAGDAWLSVNEDYLPGKANLADTLDDIRIVE